MNRTKTPEQAVEAVSDAIREITAAASTLQARLPNEPHQERAVRVMNYETEELADALPVLRDLLPKAPKADDPTEGSKS